jgi:hypothetical protein
MKTSRTTIRILILLALLLAPLSGAAPTAARAATGQPALQNASLASLPPDLQGVIAETLRRDGALAGAAAYEQQGKLLASGLPDDNFGFSVALADNGVTALIGAYGVNGEQGAAYLFTCDNYAWTLQAMLTADDGAAGDRFGISVALSDDGDVAVVGADKADVDGNADQGAVYVFFPTGGWHQVEKMTADDGAANDRLGWSVAASSDGVTIAAGAFNAEINGIDEQGAAYIFRQNGPGSWSQQGKLTLDSAAADSHIGYSVALSADGNTALVGAFAYDYMGHTDAGAALSFTRSGLTWTYEDLFGASDGANEDNFGRSVSLSDDGNIAVVGAHRADVSSVDQGQAYIFARSGGAWTEQATLQADDGAASDYFGVSVQMMGNGYVAYVGANEADVNAGANQGAVYTFALSGSTWGQVGKITATAGGANDEFGVSVALSGATLLVGARGATAIGVDSQGAAYAFMPEGSGTRVVEIAGHSANDDYFGASVALNNSGDTAVVGAYKADVDGNVDQGALYVFRRVDGAWGIWTRLTADDGAAGDKLGWSVAISSDGNTILAGAHAATVNGHAEQGAGYVFHYVSILGWSQDKLTVPLAQEGMFLGYSVALSDDGAAALLGSPKYNSNPSTECGGVFSFVKAGGVWSFEDFFYPSAGEGGDYFGRAVALSADGNTAIVGASLDDVGGNADQGSAYILARSGGQWSQVVNLTAGANGLADDRFGTSVALSGDGNTALVGAYLADESAASGGDENVGRAHLFARPNSGGDWEEALYWQGYAAGDHFGVSVALSGDGQTALVGVEGNDVSGNADQGSARLWQTENGEWGPYGYRDLYASDGAATDMFGFSAALNEDGSTALVGAYDAQLGGATQGAAYVFAETANVVYLPLVLR